MMWPFAPKRIQPGERPYACPGCKTTDPAVPLMQLGNSILRNGQVVSILNAQAWGCRACGCEWDATDNGAIIRRRTTTHSTRSVEPDAVPEPMERIPLLQIPRRAPPT